MIKQINATVMGATYTEQQVLDSQQREANEFHNTINSPRLQQCVRAVPTNIQLTSSTTNKLEPLIKEVDNGIQETETHQLAADFVCGIKRS